MGCPIYKNIPQGTLANGSYTIGISGRGEFTIDFSTLGTGSAKAKAEVLRQKIQDLLDVRIPLSGLSLDNSEKIEDPKLTNVFHSDSKGIPQQDTSKNTHITGRSCRVEAIVVGSGSNTTVEVNLHAT